MTSNNLSNKRLLVADTSPLLALARIESLELLNQLFDEVCVTQTVFQEVIAKPERLDARNIRMFVSNKKLLLVDDPEPSLLFTHLDPGEQTALDYARLYKAVVLIDEYLGRTTAKNHNIPVIGAPGILLLAKKKGFLAEIKTKLNYLRTTGYYLSDSLMQQLLDLANE